MYKQVIAMFMGEYNHTVDAKGRLIVPSKFREQLGDEFVITKGLDNCLFVYDKSFVHYRLPTPQDVSFHVSCWEAPPPVK